jgi:predicted nuclease of predicted toxin-antitoxin system
MGVSHLVGKWLNSLGHDAIHLSIEGLHTMDDFSIVEKAIDEHRIILTADIDFGHILAFNRSHYVSIIQFRIADLSPAIIISKLNIVFYKFSEQLIADHVIVTVQESKIRLKVLPFNPTPSSIFLSTRRFAYCPLPACLQKTPLHH